MFEGRSLQFIFFDNGTLIAVSTNQGIVPLPRLELLQNHFENENYVDLKIKLRRKYKYSAKYIYWLTKNIRAHDK